MDTHLNHGGQRIGTSSRKQAIKTLEVLFAIICLTMSAEARLGDTAAKITERYGEPIQIYRDVKGRIGHIHRSSGWIVLVQYIDGISQSEVYAKGDDAELNESELRSKLSENVSGDKWEEIPKSVVTKASGAGWRAWIVRRARRMSAYGPSTINDRRFHHAISFGTRFYNEQNQALDRR